VHDRRIDGVPHIFGNAGALYKNAMTWYDHQTGSIWSQPIGRAMRGALEGVELFVLPSQLTTWRSWKKEHPETLAMVNDVARVGFRQRFDTGFVIGLILADKAKAYYYDDVARVRVINDQVGSIPVAVWAAEQNFHAYVRRVDGRTLTFQARDGKIVDAETGSTWDFARGLATVGPLANQALQPVPTMSSYDWAWRDFYPQTEIYRR
jgi:hypothetical protein